MKELSEEERDKISAIKTVVCEYYRFPIDLLDTQSRKNHIPLIKQIVCLLAIKHFKTLKKYKLGLYFNTNHANVLIGVKKLQIILEEDKSFSKEIFEIEKILYLKAIIGKGNSSKELNDFYDLNNFISANNQERFVLFKGYTKDEVQELMSDDFIIEEHSETKQFIFIRKN